MSAPERFENVTAVAKANVYFEGRVVSHSILLAGGEKKTLGLIYPGKFHFGTDAAERMEIVAGLCRVKIGFRLVDRRLDRRKIARHLQDLPRSIARGGGVVERGRRGLLLVHHGA